MRRLAVLAVLLAAIASAHPQRGVVAEQLHFTAEQDGVDHLVVIPEGALAVLSRDPDVLTVMKSEGATGSDVLRKWLSAAEVHLGGPNEKDLVIMACGPLAGANVTTFWVLRPHAGGYELLLNGPAHDLIVKHTRTGEYRDIDLLVATAVSSGRVSLRFDGVRYAEPNGHRK